MGRRNLCVLLAIALLLGLSAPAAAQRDYTPQAETLKALGLFKGTDQGFELDRPATRAEAAVMLVRLLGKEAEAVETMAYYKEYYGDSPEINPFTDVPEWASAQVNYLYVTGVTNGVTDTLFGAADLVTPSQYATFLLRALGYNEWDGDFSWNSALISMVDLGIVDSAEAMVIASTTGFTRGQMVQLSCAALFAPYKNSAGSLLERLYLESRAVTAEQLLAASKDPRVADIAARYLPLSLPAEGAIDRQTALALLDQASFTVVSRIGYRLMTGRGFFLTEDGLAVINYNGLPALCNGVAELGRGKDYPITGVVAADPDRGVAVVQVGGRGFTALPRGDAGALQSGQRIYSILGSGVLSNAALNRAGQRYLQFSISTGANDVYGDAFGSPLLNEFGQVIGILSDEALFDTANLARPVTVLDELDLSRPPRALRYYEAHQAFGLSPLESPVLQRESVTGPLSSGALVKGTLSAGAAHDYTVRLLRGNDVMASICGGEGQPGLSVQLLTADGGTLLAGDRVPAGESFSLLQTYLPTGDYRLRVTAEQGAGNLPYELFWVSYNDWGRDLMYYYSTELEPNNTQEQASYLVRGAQVVSCFFSNAQGVSDTLDIDYHRFTMDRAGTAQLGVDCAEQLSIQLLDADGRVIASATHPPETWQFELIEWELEPGDYCVRVAMEQAMASWEHHSYNLSLDVHD